MKWILAAVAVLFLPVMFIGAAFAELGPDASETREWSGRPEDLNEIPAEFLALYTEGAEHLGIPLPVLAAVGKIECNHNRNTACTTANSAGAVGPMQFLADTFARYASASGSPNPSILDPRDSIFAAAAKLAADGVNRDPWAAIYSYNHSDSYVAKVVAWAVAYGWVPGGEVLSRTVLGHPNLSLREVAESDVRSGRVDPRVLAILSILANSHRLSYVGPLVTGHSTYVAGTDRISNHTSGRAVDLPVVDGETVTSNNAAAQALVLELLALPPELVPDEIGSPWLLTAPGIDIFYHSDHIHYGVSP